MPLSCSWASASMPSWPQHSAPLAVPPPGSPVAQLLAQLSVAAPAATSGGCAAVPEAAGATNGVEAVFGIAAAIDHSRGPHICIGKVVGGPAPCRSGRGGTSPVGVGRLMTIVMMTMVNVVKMMLLIVALVKVMLSTRSR